MNNMKRSMSNLFVYLWGDKMRTMHRLEEEMKNELSGVEEGNERRKEKVVLALFLSFLAL